MAGIYIHIPFCKQACSYCDFHFSTNTRYINKMIEAICIEIIERKNFFTNNVIIQSIYFGGGTPSFISTSFIEKIFSIIESNFKIANNPEITLESNPDDLNKQKINELRKSFINRLSIGVQSFIERDLKLMNRAHTALQAQDAIKRAQDAGFENISIDLIYGTPNLSNLEFQQNLGIALQLQIPHLSCYSLTIEEKTLIHYQILKNILKQPSENQSAEQFLIAQQFLKESGYNHYEISNWAKPTMEAVHNSSYWEGLPYLGVGPSAHSYNGLNVRSYNVKNNSLYLKQIFDKKYQPHIEELTVNEQFNEYILIKLRTAKGVYLSELEQKFGYDYSSHFVKCAKPYVEQGLITLNNNVYILTTQGKLLADKITSDCFIVK